MDIINYYTATWCAPCKFFKPVAYKILRESEIEFVFVDADERTDLMQMNNVMSIPTILFFRDGEEFGRTVGVSEVGLRDLIARFKENQIIART